MANVEHSLLTGASLHEPKGLAAVAASGQVYISDGLGSGAWTASTTFNPFGNQLFHVRDQVTSGTASQGALTDATWNTRRLQTSVTNEITSSSGPTSNQIILPAGTYYAKAWCIHRAAGVAGTTQSLEGKLRLRNITGAATLLTGPGQLLSTFQSTDTVALQFLHVMEGRFTLAGSTTIELQQWNDHLASTGTAGTALSTGEVEVYAELMIWKI